MCFNDKQFTIILFYLYGCHFSQVITVISEIQFAERLVDYSSSSQVMDPEALCSAIIYITNVVCFVAKRLS